MGSLVPGWDATIAVPRGPKLTPRQHANGGLVAVKAELSVAHRADLQPDNIDTINKEQEPEGYFARLRSQRHSHGGVDDIAPSLARLSAPQSFARTSTQSTKEPQTTRRSQTLAHGGSPIMGKGGMDPHKYQFTDWTQELRTLAEGKSSLRRTSVDTVSAARAGEHDRHGSAWWRALEVGHLNEHPDAQPNGGSEGHSTFVPQFIQKQKLEYDAMSKDKVEEGPTK